MLLSKYLLPDLIVLNVHSKDKWDLLDLMVRTITKSPSLQNHPEISLDESQEAIITREKQTSTGIGKGFAFPHARMASLKTVAVCLAILDKPLDFESLDGNPVEIACMVLTPLESPTIALKIMSQVAGLFSDVQTKKMFLKTNKPEEIFRYIKKKAIAIDVPITAEDIMRKPIFTVYPDTPLKYITRQMSLHRMNAVAVVNEKMNVIGEISCDLLFKFGIPDFFAQLKSVSFISEFDPFEKYFREEAHSVASDIMTSDIAVMSPDATLLEIVFALTVKRHPKVYVVKDGKHVGVIDQSAVLDRIINF
ncbi:MAG: PTS sugar transporter subunit IIA [Candidatus Theseobacter exili]|nr:PTS sugar transporter subunit IIA [Candidatus Theseobacter exili]